MSAIRILVADDHPVVRQGIRQIIDSAGGMLVADEAANGRELLDRAKSVDHDLVPSWISPCRRSTASICSNSSNANARAFRS